MHLRRLDDRVPGGITLDSSWIGRLGLVDSSLRVLGGAPLPPAHALTPGRPASNPVGFGPQYHVAVALGRFCTGYSSAYVITCHDSLGRRTFTIRREFTARRVTDSAKAALRRALAGIREDGSAMFQGSLAEHRRRVAAAAAFATTYPAFSQLLLSKSGELWVRSYATEDGLSPFRSRWRSARTPSVWSVFDSNGRWIADCRLPSRFAPAEIGRDHVPGVTRDDDDVESIMLLRLQRCQCRGVTCLCDILFASAILDRLDHVTTFTIKRRVVPSTI